MSPPSAVVHGGRARPALQDQRHGRVRNHPQAADKRARDPEASHVDTSHPAGPLRTYDVPHRRIVTFT
ncbi:hypothetical protein AB0G35_11270 [Streptomyces sp. NPDC021749]|uniref:hypothetical protein n=1 Tax=Streptomyces sp. NPDC021749 TaxID=3154905 RepID=UPI00341091A4